MADRREAPGETVTFKGRILYLTEDPELLEAQLAGKDARRTIPSAPLARQHLDRRDHARLGLLLLRRDARAVLPGRPARRHGQAGRDQERRLRRHRQRHLEGLRLARARRRRTASSTAGMQLVVAKSIEKIYRQNCAEHRPAHEHRLRRSLDAHRARRGDPDRGVHARARSDQRRHRRARRALRVQQGAPRRRGRRRPRSRRRARPMTLVREDHRRARDRRRARPASSACPR